MYAVGGSPSFMKKRDYQQPTQGNAGRQSRNEQIVRANITFFVRPNLSRRSKALINLLRPLLPEHDIEHLAHELATETRRDQNLMADEIFASLVDSSKVSGPKDPRLIVKVIDLRDRLIADINPFRFDRCE